MKKLLSKIISLLLVVSAMFAFTACAEVEDGSKITRVKFVVEFYDENGQATSYDVYAKLYENFAPNTIAHVKGLIEKGYYTNTCISNVTNGYAQFGDYTFGEGLSLVAKDQGSAINGEFYKNGVTGNKLNAAEGALVLLHDVKGAEKYDTGRATIAISYSASSFDAEGYCIFGKLVADDGNADASDEMGKLSSLGKMQKITERISDDDGRKLFYCITSEEEVTNGEEGEEEEKVAISGKYITYLSYEDGMKYVVGSRFYKDAADVANDNEAVILSAEQANDLIEKMSENATDFLRVPVLKVIIKSAEIVK